VWRENKNRQKAMMMGYLVDAYDKLALSANRVLDQNKIKYAEMMESAVAKVQLFGGPEQIRILHECLNDWTRTERIGQPSIHLDPLSFALRNSLRKELQLSLISSDVHWIRPLGGAAPRA
jgi:hypothetical protein